MASSDAAATEPVLRSPTFPHELFADKRKAYAAAATAARKKRRNTLARKSLNRQNAVKMAAQLGTRTPSMQAPHPIMALALCAVPGKRKLLASGDIAIVHPDAKGVEEIGTRLNLGEHVAYPTECTYEILQQYKPSLQHRAHVHIPEASALETYCFWRQQLPKKSYAIKFTDASTNGGPAPTFTTAERRTSSASTSCLATGSSPTCANALTVATFNETAHVVRRICSKIWPGPVLLHVQVRQPIPGLSITVNSSRGEQNYTSESSVQHYLAVRNACHPLTVKVCKEFYKCKSSSQQTPPSSPSLAPQLSPNASPAGLHSFLSNSASSPGQLPSRVASSGSLSSVSSIGSLVTAPLLVGSPMVYDRKSRFVTTASQAIEVTSTIAAVLDGEERREVFAVPTCEYGIPWPLLIWIDADCRTIRLKKQPSLAADNICNSKSAMRMSPDCVARPCDTNTSKAVILQGILKQALRSGVPANHKERIIHAVMLKWKVLAEEE